MLSFKKSLGRAFLLLHIFFIAGVSAFALPKVESYVGDSSGEYVYYRDYTFSGEAYMGFLYYNDSTYAARYYAPATSSSPAKDITAYLNVDPNAEYMSFTGDKLVGVSSEEDTDIVNYIYDLMIELTKLRQKVKFSTSKDLTQSAKLELFNGDIKLTYNPMVPIFGIKNITKTDGSYLWNIATVGMLTAADDRSFSDFKGFPATLKDNDRKTKIKNAKKSVVVSGSQKVTLDEGWTQVTDGIWLFGDYGMVMLASGAIPVTGKDAEPYIVFNNRFLCHSNSGTYNTWNTMTVTEEKPGSQKFTYLNYDPSNGDVIRSIWITSNKDGKFQMFSLTVFDAVYQKNKKYFDALVASYTN